jgi:hypothetical protein
VNAAPDCSRGEPGNCVAVLKASEEDVDELDVDYPNLRKLARTAREFAVYITSNAGSLINYGKRISSCLAEYGECGHQQTFRETSASAMDAARHTPAVADPDASARWHGQAAI